jgi:hypothetical protein
MMAPPSPILFKSTAQTKKKFTRKFLDVNPFIREICVILGYCTQSLKNIRLSGENLKINKIKIRSTNKLLHDSEVDNNCHWGRYLIIGVDNKL